MRSETPRPDLSEPVVAEKEKKELTGEQKILLADIWTKVVINDDVSPADIEKMTAEEIRKWLFDSLMHDTNSLAEEWGLAIDRDLIDKIQGAAPGAEREALEVDYFRKAHAKVDVLAKNFFRSPEKSTKWDSWPKKMRETREFNCVGATLLGIRALRESGIENYIGTPYGHIVNIVKTSTGNWFYVDFRNGERNVLKIDPEVVMIGGTRVLKISTPKLDYRLIPIHDTTDIPEAIIVNLASMAKEAEDADVPDRNPAKKDAKKAMARYGALLKREDAAEFDIGELGERIFPEIIGFDASPEMKNEEARIKHLHNFDNEIDDYVRSLPKEAGARIDLEMKKKKTALLKLVANDDRAIFDGASDELKGFLTALINSLDRLKKQPPEIRDEALAAIVERIKSESH